MVVVFPAQFGPKEPKILADRLEEILGDFRKVESWLIRCGKDQIMTQLAERGALQTPEPGETSVQAPTAPFQGQTIRGSVSHCRLPGSGGVRRR